MNIPETTKEKGRRAKERKQQLKKLRKNQEKLKKHGISHSESKELINQVKSECNTLKENKNQENDNVN